MAFGSSGRLNAFMEATLRLAEASTPRIALIFPNGGPILGSTDS